LNCANCGLENVAEGQHCSRCGHLNSAPAPAAAAASANGPAVVFGLATGVIVGPFLFVVLALLPAFGGRSYALGERGTAALYLIETIGLALVMGFLFTPFARLPVFFRVAGLTTVIIALGGLSICDFVAVGQLRNTIPHPAFTPAHR
jgi:hypothetical protein